jgi:hypothetical protein
MTRKSTRRGKKYTFTVMGDLVEPFEVEEHSREMSATVRGLMDKKNPLWIEVTVFRVREDGTKVKGTLYNTKKG